MPIVTQSTTGLSVPVLLISSAILTPDATPNAPGTTIVQPTKPASGSSVATRVEIPTRTCAARVPPAKRQTTRQCVPVPKATPAIRLSVVASLRAVTFATPTRAVQEPTVELDLTDRVRIGLCAPAQLVTEAIRLLAAQEVSVSMTASVRLTARATITTAGHRASRRAARTPSAKHAITAPSAPVPPDLSVTH